MVIFAILFCPALILWKKLCIRVLVKFNMVGFNTQLFWWFLFDDNKNATDFFSLLDFLEKVWKPMSQSSNSKNVLG